MNVYEILGIPRTASQAEIDKAYAEASRKYGLFNNPEDMEKIVFINTAYSILRNPTAKQKIDSLGGSLPNKSAGNSSSQKSAPAVNVQINHYYPQQGQQSPFPFKQTIIAFIITMIMIGAMIIPMMVSPW